MAENILRTRIQLKYDTISNWNSSTLILKQGEVAIAEVPMNTSNSGLTPPAIGIKVGDGVHLFSALPWIQAAAGDVYDWAKASTKPTYQASEISGLSDYISGQINDSNTQYRLLAGTGSDAYKYFLQSKDIGSNTWTTINTADSAVIDLSDAFTRITAIENWGDTTNSTLYDLISSGATEEINKLDVTDTAVSGQFVTAVSETNGKISVSRASLSASDIGSGELSVLHGGTGVNSLNSGEVLVGNGTSPVTTRAIDSTPDDNSTNLITSGGVKEYVDTAVEGLAHAMHFIGSTQTQLYDGATTSRLVAKTIGSLSKTTGFDAGDVVLYNTAEYVWDGSQWILLGDEGSYAIKGSIVNADIASNAAIAQSKIAGLTDALTGKVDAESGKGLSTNDYTDADQTKLSGIAAGAQVNSVETVSINGGTPVSPDANKNIDLTLDLSNIGTVKGARVPTLADASVYQDVTLDSSSGKLTFNNIAVTGDVDNLTQTSGTILVFDCGNGSDKKYETT